MNDTRREEPTHRYVDENGEEKLYFGGSKNWKQVSPYIKDKRNFHYAAGNRVYLLFRNKENGEWQFPTSSFKFGGTMMEAREKLFSRLTEDKWRVRHIGRAPFVHTIRDFSESEISELGHSYFYGVRTYYFNAFHLLGMPELKLDETCFDDYAWVPLPELNKYFTEHQWDQFAKSLKLR